MSEEMDYVKSKSGIAKKANRGVMFLFRMGLPFALRPGGTPAGVQKVSKTNPKPGTYNLSCYETSPEGQTVAY